MSNNNLNNYILSIYNTYRHDSIIPLLFFISAAWRKEILATISFYPLLYIYGPMASGKSSLTRACLNLYSKERKNILNGNSFSNNVLSELYFNMNSINIVDDFEYKKDISNSINTIWNGASLVSPEDDWSSLVFISNNFNFKNEYVAKRFLIQEMNSTDFSDDQQKCFKDIFENTYVLNIYDELPELDDFSNIFNRVTNLMNNFVNAPLRIIHSYAILLAVYEISSSKILFPFSYQKAQQTIIESIEKQSEKWLKISK